MQKQDINELFRKYKTDNEIYHDLMPLRMREILLVATIYDAFILEQDGMLSEMIFGEYHQLNLSHAPRITSACSDAEALEKLTSLHFDLVIVVSRINRQDSCELSRKIKEINPTIPILLLLNDNAGLGSIGQNRQLLKHFDNVFVWNGHSEIFLAMVKYVEDKINVFNDTRIGLVRVILLVEDSVRYYSRYLPLLYTVVMRQTQQLMSQENLVEMAKMHRLRCRPKILLATSYEKAMSIFETFQDYLLCVISDVKFPKDGTVDEMAGIKLINEVRSLNPDVPVLLQSSEPDIAHTASRLGVNWVDKNSHNLAGELSDFFYQHLGFGDFVFRNQAGQEIGRARSMDDLKERLQQIPAESILFHASRNHFSAWLMARGEVQIAKVVFRAKVEDFDHAEELRRFLIQVGDLVKDIKTKGKIINFDEHYLTEGQFIFRLNEGSIGGKGRGIAFINSLLTDSALHGAFPGINIKIPQTAIIGIDEFPGFIERNSLADLVRESTDHDLIKRRFLMGSLSPELKGRLRTFLEHVTHPLAVRSSGLLEDSLSHPLSGLYQTFFLPNNHPDLNVRLNQLMEAIKMIYASVYSPSARAYFDAIDYRIDEERMAVIIQKVCGSARNGRVYPHISGVAQSFNFYPYAYVSPEDGVCMIALGLGKFVVGGERSFRFCPAYPDLEMMTAEEQLKLSQKHFYALDLAHSTLDLFNGDDATLLTLDLAAAEKDGVLPDLVSTWDHHDQCLRPGMEERGTRVLNFANVVRYEAFPLARVVREILSAVRDSMETPVEIEFAVNLDPNVNGKPTFYLLQIKHLLRDVEECTLDLDELQPADLALYCNRGMGNGTFDDLCDVVWVDPKCFDKTRTEQMARDVAILNESIKRHGRRYLLIGPGRWGTRDRWLGIPVNWPMISHAQAIVEYSLEDFRVEASLGSHFFHNVTSLNIGYFTVPFNSPPNFIDWDWLRSLPVVERLGDFVHSRLEHPLAVVMDGRKGVSVVFKPGRRHPVAR